MRIKFSRQLSIILIISLFIYNVLSFIQISSAEVISGSSNIVNGGFEEPDLKSSDTTNTGWANTDDTNVTGWETTATDNKIEMGWLDSNGASPHMVETKITEITGDGAANGYQFAEVIADETKSSMFQTLTVKANNNYTWEVYHRGRSGIDTLAVIIADNTGITYEKSAKSEVDYFNQVIAWLKSNGVTSPAENTTENYTVYTTNLKESSEFEEATSGSYFSFTKDSEHTVKFEVYLMSSGKGDWECYTETYRPEVNKSIIFALTTFSSSSTGSTSSTSGNLIDKISFKDSTNIEMLTNGSFDEYQISGGYASVKAVNNDTPTNGIGWSSTSSVKLIEIGNILKGNPYKFDIVTTTTIFNKAWVREGNQYVELNANQESSLYQIVNTDAGKMYKWGLSHRGRSGIDTMALIIGPNQDYEPKKATANSRDQLMQIADWLQSQTERALDIPEQGCSNMITLYSPKFADNGNWELSENIFSWTRDSLHTEEWCVWLISSANDTWHDYGEFDSDADYDFKYIVPEGQPKSIFGFVSYNSTTPESISSSKKLTYGNLLDNIVFKEYYYINVNNSANSNGGTVYITNDDGTFIFETPGSGWALAGSEIKIHIKEGEREFLGGSVDDSFIAKGDWIYDSENNEYIYVIDDINKPKDLDIKYVAKTIVYDSRSNYPYDYDEAGGGYEVPLDQGFTEYISHEPYAEDGWKFIGWEYISTLNSNAYLIDGVHKVVFNENTEDITLSTFEIYNILPDDSLDLVVDSIPYDEGITFVAKWEYRQRVISMTFDKLTSNYQISTEGGYTGIKVIHGAGTESTDYEYNSTIVGKELYSSANNTYIQVSAHNTIGYTFNGWYDAEDNLVSTSTSYTYKVQDGNVTELYAHFEPLGYKLTVSNNVTGNFGDTSKYFKVDFTFSNLRADKAYMITGVYSGQIDIDGENITNPFKIKANSSGEASVTIYIKDGQSINFIDLPENCTYTVACFDYSDYGYSTVGNVYNQVLTSNSTINLYQNSEVSPPMGVHFENRHWYMMLSLGIGILGISIIHKWIKRKQGEYYE